MTDALRVCVELDGQPIEAGTAYFTHRGTLATSFRCSRTDSWRSSRQSAILSSWDGLVTSRI